MKLKTIALYSSLAPQTDLAVACDRTGTLETIVFYSILASQSDHRYGPDTVQIRYRYGTDTQGFCVCTHKKRLKFDWNLIGI